MTTSSEVFIKDVISLDLSFRDSAERFFRYLDSLPNRRIIIDFSGVKSISRSFAHEYHIRKMESELEIVEKNVPRKIEKMFSIVKKPITKTPIFDIDSVKAICL